MSLGDHLEELRARLIRALLALAIGIIICFSMGKYIINFIKVPFDAVTNSYTQKKYKDPNALPPTLSQVVLLNLIDGLSTDPNAPYVDPNLIQYVQAVYTKTLHAWTGSPDMIAGLNTTRLMSLGPSDALLSFMKISFITGLILTAPWVFYQIWMFVAAGLYANEQKCVKTAIPFSAGLFMLGALFFLFVVAPLTLRFFLVFGDMIGVTCNWTFQKYISFVTTLMLVFGLAFQTPIAILILNRTGLVSTQVLKSNRKYVLLGTFIVAAMATPPDPLSQVSLAIPLYGLYELGVVLCFVFNKNK
ncbi:MAG: twin-arginine translocase subunit TatC [Phycisphaeraceae bacterium]|nr:twin-arginine translocase subunit TatC [Phycisphaeraceae bacterium]